MRYPNLGETCQRIFVTFFSDKKIHLLFSPFQPAHSLQVCNITIRFTINSNLPKSLMSFTKTPTLMAQS